MEKICLSTRAEFHLDHDGILFVNTTMINLTSSVSTSLFYQTTLVISMLLSMLTCIKVRMQPALGYPKSSRPCPPPRRQLSTPSYSLNSRMNQMASVGYSWTTGNPPLLCSFLSENSVKFSALGPQERTVLGGPWIRWTSPRTWREG